MKRSQRVAFGLFSVLLLAGAQGAIARTRDYSLHLVAQTSGSLTSIDAYTSVNDARLVAFTGGENGISKVWVVPQNGAPTPISFGSSTRTFLGAEINNESPARVASRDQVAGAPATYFERKWGADGVGITVVGRSPTHFTSGLSFGDVNDSGIMAFSALVNGATNTALFAGSVEPPTQLAVFTGSVQLRPQISNNNLIAIRDASSRIVLYPYPSGMAEVIAGPATNYNSASAWPGISADGSVVAFLADHGNGPGIFVSVRLSNGTRQIYRMSGEGLEPPTGITSYDSNQRISVITDGQLSTEKRIRVVFAGTQGGLLGIYSVGMRLREGAAPPQPCPPRLILQANETLAGKTVTSLFLNDPLNTKGDVAFRVGFSDGSAGVVLAEPYFFLDCVPDFKQADAPWATQPYDHYYSTVSADNDHDGSIDEDPTDNHDNDGDGSVDEDREDNIRRWGCYLTGCVDIINYYGKLTGFSTDPLTLNAWLKTHMGYDGSRVRPDSCAKYAQGNGVSMYFERSVGYRDDARLQDSLCRRDAVMLRVLGNHHSVIATGETDLDGTETFAISDPGHSAAANKTLQPYGYGYDGLRVFSSRINPSCTPVEKLAPDATGLATMEISVEDPVELLLVDSLGRRTGFDPNTGRTYDEIPNSGYVRESTSDPDDDTYISPEQRIVTLADQPDGTYRIQANGHGTAGYIVNVFTYDNTGAPQEVFQAGNTSPGEIDLFDISVTGGGNIAGSTPAGTCSALSGTLLLTIVSNTIHWTPLAGAAGYDVQSGDIGSLRASAGDFTVSTQACLANNVGGAQVPWPGAPTAGSAWWAVARGRNCAGGGSYDEGIGPSQQGGRDAEIGQAAAHCP